MGQWKPPRAQPSPDCIAAVATAHGRGGIGIVRVSGPNLANLAQPLLGKAPPPRVATYSSFYDAAGNVVDQGIAVFYPAPNSYTGEDVLELQGHGGVVLPQLVLRRCLELGARLAEPGEFTQRAFLNNKLDLAQAESVADLIDATTAQAARSAMRSLQGDFSEVIQGLVAKLIRLRMLVEAMLDFPEEEIGLAESYGLEAQLGEISREVQRVFGLAKQGSILREGAHVVLVGQPNVGKSSLLNRLCGEELALVSAIPGTTRDVIRQAIQLNGVPLHIVDTAGLREAADEVERMGIARTHSMLEKADVVLVVSEAATPMPEDREILGKIPAVVPVLQVVNKIDLSGGEPNVEENGGATRVYLSAKTGVGVDLLREKLLTLIGWHQEAGVFMARERHLRALESARAFLGDAAEVVHELDLFAEELRLAQEELGTITGEFSADDLLGEIFSKFCIGK